MTEPIGPLPAPFRIRGTFGPQATPITVGTLRDVSDAPQPAGMIPTVCLGQVTFELTPRSDLRFRFSRSLCTFDAEMDDGIVRQVTLWFPVTDRRVARRIARKTGRRFRKVGKGYEFSDATKA